MPKFRSRPTEIEAWQFTGAGTERGVCCCFAGYYRAHLHTMHEGQIAELKAGDWIVPEPIADRYYPIKPDVFEKKYEPTL